MDLNRPTQTGLPGPAPFDPWSAPGSADFPGPWADPAEERARMRRKLRRLGLGFSSLGLGLVIASFSTIAMLLLFLSGPGHMALFQAFRQWELVEETAVVWSTLIGVALIWGPWPDREWLRRSGLLLLMCLVDVVLWSLDHATELGLSDAKVGHEWLRRSLGQAIGWSEFALIASLAGDMAARLGEAQAVEFGRAARSLATTGAMVWAMYFYSKTNWDQPFWPLREVPLNRSTLMLMLGFFVLVAINLVQVTALSIMAGRACGRELRRLAAEDRAQGPFLSPSEAGWADPSFDASGGKPAKG